MDGKDWMALVLRILRAVLPILSGALGGSIVAGCSMFTFI